MNLKVRYPVGEQSFEQLRRGNFLYVDKTRYIEQIINGCSYYSLCRPRRFGKSLFLSTLKCFFEGKRDLFKGLYIDSIDWDWASYPVLYLDLNYGNYKNEGELEKILDDQLKEWEERYSVTPEIDSISIRFQHVIQAASETTGKSVVILVDEYDKPFVKSLDDKKRFERYQSELDALYSNFKSSADYIHLVFLTGVSRVVNPSVFSGFNNIPDCSFDIDLSAICGITEDELLDNFQEGIAVLAQSYDKSTEEISKELKRRYGGCHFSERSPDIYNPHSLLSAFSSENLGNYWIESGTPSLLIEQLKKKDLHLESVDGVWRSVSDLTAITFDLTDTIALLYQSGYLTIKSYDEDYDLFQLGFPNEEVSESFYQFIVPYYESLHKNESK